MSESKVTITDHRQDKTVELPIIEGSMGPPAVDIRRLHRDLGFFSFDTGFIATASCKSNITYIDGEQGILLYRGYPVAELAEHSNFPEVAYLLLHGELPNHTQLEGLEQALRDNSMIHEKLRSFFDGFYHNAHPMAVMVGVVGSLSAFYHDSTNLQDPQDRLMTAYRLIAKMPTIAAASYKHSIGEPFVYPDDELSYAGNLLRMLFAVPTRSFRVNPVAEKALELLFILHADHEQNASTSTVRMAGSSGANPYACIAAGIASLWGPAHGGANEAVLRMLHEIGDIEAIPRYIARAKDKDDPFRLMGFGHRVYKSYDPRAKLIRQVCHELLDELGQGDEPLFQLALRLEEVALSDDYFRERNLYPNVDFYSGLIYRVLGIPTNMFTVMFAIARTAGWVAHWMEMMAEPDHRIGRPRQVYSGPQGPKPYTPLTERGA